LSCILALLGVSIDSRDLERGQNFAKAAVDVRIHHGLLCCPGVLLEPNVRGTVNLEIDQLADIVKASLILTAAVKEAIVPHKSLICEYGA
jgi:hypothetical protein